MLYLNLLLFIPSVQTFGRVSPKLKIFLWRLLHNALAIFDNLVRRDVLHDPICPIYRSQPEILGHIFFWCLHARAIWFVSPYGYKIDSVGFSSFMI